MSQPENEPLQVSVRASQIKQWHSELEAALDPHIKFIQGDEMAMLKQAYEERGKTIYKIRNQIRAYIYNLP